MRRKTFIAVGLAGLLLGLWLWGRGTSDLEEAASPEGASTRAATTAKRGSSERSSASAAHGPGQPGMDSATAPEGATPSGEEGTLRVEVSTASGPRPGARVMLYLRVPAGPTARAPAWRVAGSGLTDGTGAVALPTRAGRYLVAARAEGFATARAEVTRPWGEARTHLRLMLDAGAALEGTTVEKSSRAALPLVELTLTPRFSGTGDARASAPEEEHATTTSDARGTFHFQGLARGEYQLEARAPGHAPKRLARVHVPSTGLAVELEGSAFIEGFVEQSDGKPAAGAHVSALGAGDVFTAEAGPGGGFSLDVPPGVYPVSARQGDLTAAAPERVVVGAGMTVRDVRLRLGAATALAGVVRRKDSGAPIAQASICVSASDCGEVARGRSAEDGRFEVGGLAPGTYDVSVEAPGFKALERRGLTVLEGQRFEFVAELLTHGRIEGTVVDAEQRPLAGVQVVAERKWGPLEGALPAVTDASGGFVLDGVPPGDVHVAARRPGGETNVREYVKVEPGQTARVRLRLLDEGTLEGTVRLTGGRVPPRPASVSAHRLGAPRSERVTVPAAADGTFSLRVGAGRYQLAAWMPEASGQSDAQEQVVELPAGQTRHVVLEVREAQKPLLVTVLEPNGAPSVGATLMGSEAGQSTILLETLTDESGQATVVADAVGSDRLHLWATNGGRRGDLLSVPATGGHATLQLSPGGRLTGSVRSAGGRAVTGFRLVVSPVRTDEDFTTQLALEFTGDRFTVEDVFASRLTVTATLPDGRAGTVKTAASAGQTTRVEVVVEAGASLSGRLLDTATGAPLREAFVEVDGLHSPTTGPDGRFRVEDLAPGPHRVTAWSRGHDIADKQVTLTPGKTLELGDWRLGPQHVEPGRLGLLFGMSGNDVTVSWIAEGSPAAALQVGDVVTALDGATVLTPGEARQRELGPPGSPLTVAFLRGGERRTLTLTRAP